MPLGKIQMALFAALAAAVTVGSFAYIFIARPAYLHATRDGVPYLTPPVINPVDGTPLDVGMLVRHFTGKDGSHDAGS